MADTPTDDTKIAAATTDATPVAPAPERAPEPAAAATDAAPAAEPAAEPAAAAATPDWREKRIATLTAQKRERDAQLAAKDAEIASLRAGQTAPNQQAVEARAAELAAQIAATQSFNDACNALADKGRVAFGAAEFDARTSALYQFVYGAGDPLLAGKYNQLVQAALKTGAGDAILYDLGGDLNDADRLLALPPIDMAVELTKRATKAGAVAVSSAPKPIKPVGARSASHSEIDPTDPERSDNLTSAQWWARRNAQVAAQGKR